MFYWQRETSAYTWINSCFPSVCFKLNTNLILQAGHLQANRANVVLASVKPYCGVWSKMRRPCHLHVRGIQAALTHWWILKAEQRYNGLPPVSIKGWHSDWRLWGDIIRAARPKVNSAALNVVTDISGIKLHYIACFLFLWPRQH